MEIMIVLVIALVVFGPKRLPELGKSVGKGIREFRGSVSGEHPDTDEAPLAVEQPPVVAQGPATKTDTATNSHA